MAESDARLSVVFEAKIDKLQESMNKVIRSTNGAAARIQKDVDAVNRRFQLMGSTAGDVSGRIRQYLAAIGVGLSVREVVQYSDAWTEARNKLAAAGVEMAKLAGRQNDLADLANETRTGFAETVDLYAKLTRSTKELGASEAQVAAATETVNKAFKAGGAAASEQRNAILQLGQALGSGVLQGDELRSLRENAPLLAKAIADEFGTSIAGLKKLGEKGKLTSDRVFSAILKGAKEIDAQFAVTVPTVSDSITRLQTEFGRYINDANAVTGASASLSAFIAKVADDFDLFADAAIVAASVLGGAFAAQAVIRTVVQLRALQVTTAAGSVALGTLGVRAQAAAGSMAILRAAMAFLGGPWGVAITAIGAALGYLALRSSEAAREARALDDAHEKLDPILGRVRESLDAAAAASGALRDQHLSAADAAIQLATAEARSARGVVDATKARIAALKSEQSVRAGMSGNDLIGAALELKLKHSERALAAAYRVLEEAGVGVVRGSRGRGTTFVAKTAEDALKERVGDGKLKPSATSTKTAKIPRDRSDERTAQIEAAMADAERTLLQSMSQLARDVDERAAIQRRIIEAEKVASLARLDKQAADIADDKGLDQAKKKELTAQIAVAKSLNEEAARREQRLVEMEAADERARNALERMGIGADQQAEMLEIQASFARSAKERRAIELQLLDLADQRLIAELELVKSLNSSTAAEKELAQARIDALVQTRGAREARVRADTRGPLEDWVHQNSGDRASRMEEIERRGVQAFDGLADGLAAAIVNAQSLGDVARNVFRQMAADMLAATIKASAAKGASALLAVFGGARAGGGPVAASKAYLVGEKGPELFVPKGSGNIIPNGALSAPKGGGGGSRVVNVRMSLDLTGANGDQAIRQIVGQAAQVSFAQAVRQSNKDAPAAMQRFRMLGG